MPQNRVHDPQVLRAISHPVRNRILSELDAQGSMRAADLARELGIPANSASFHLRSLAKYGLVVEDAAAARDKRDRVWKLAHDKGLEINLEDFTSTPGGQAAASVFRRTSADWGHVVVEAAFAGEHAPGEHRSVTDTSLRLTPDEARALTHDLREVVDRWSERTRGREQPDGATTFLYFGALLPHPGRVGSDDS